MLNADDAVPQQHTSSGPGTGGVGRARGLRRWLFLSALVAALAGVTCAVPAQAAIVSPPPACLSGYLCLVLSPSGTGNVVLVPAGQSQSFPSPGLPVVELANRTTIVYCLIERLSSGSLLFSGIVPGSTQVISVAIMDVFPGPACPV